MPSCEIAGNEEAIFLGKKLISSGKVGCIVLAGGDGSRLGGSGLKGEFPLSLVQQKTLFQMIYERAFCAADYFGCPLHLAVMASPLNYEQTRQAFPKEVELFEQEMVPLLDLQKNPLDELRPNGNGRVLKHFYASGIYEKWKRAGVEYVQIVLIDNPLAEPFDPNQVGVHFKKKAEISLKVIEKRDPSEQVGVIGQREGKIAVVEYSENPPKGWNLASTSLFCLSMPFIEKMHAAPLPFHLVKKMLKGKPVYKRECFIFDLLPLADHTTLIHYPREETFAPLKNRKDVGPVQRALLERDRRVFHQLTGFEPSQKIFELAPQFHFPPQTLREKWKGKALPSTPYVEP